jgi:uncharacterized sporulation protein YeaH/YhbH (DUF444 family)
LGGNGQEKIFRGGKCKRKKQIPFGDDNQKGTDNGEGKSKSKGNDNGNGNGNDRGNGNGKYRGSSLRSESGGF